MRKEKNEIIIKPEVYIVGNSNKSSRLLAKLVREGFPTHNVPDNRTLEERLQKRENLTDVAIVHNSSEPEPELQFVENTAKSLAVLKPKDGTINTRYIRTKPFSAAQNELYDHVEAIFHFKKIDDSSLENAQNDSTGPPGIQESYGWIENAYKKYSNNSTLPRNVRANLALRYALALKERGRVRRASTILERALDLDPELQEAIFHLVDASAEKFTRNRGNIQQTLNSMKPRIVASGDDYEIVNASETDDLESSISFLEATYRKTNAPSNALDLAAVLVIKCRQEEDKSKIQVNKERAFNLLKDFQNSVSAYEKAIMFAPQSRKIVGARILRIKGLHPVYQASTMANIGRNVVFKSYNTLEPAQREADHINKLAKVQYQMMTPKNKFLKVPEWSILLEGKDKKGKDQVFVATEYIEGDDLSKTIKGLKKLKNNAIERAVDYGYVLARSYTIINNGNIQDIRIKSKNKEYAAEIAGEVRPVGFYTARIFNKLINPLKEHAGLKLSQKDERNLANIIHEEIDNPLLKEVPDIFYLPYTDNNLDNFRINFTPHALLTDEEVFLEGQMYRLDHENGCEKRPFFSDFVTTFEHELCSNTISSRYLTLRVIAQILHDEWAKQGKNEEELNNLLQHSRRHRSYKKFERKVNEYMQKFNPDLNVQKCMDWLALSSLERHLTILGDKIVTVSKFEEEVKKLTRKHKILEEYEEMRKKDQNFVSDHKKRFDRGNIPNYPFEIVGGFMHLREEYGAEKKALKHHYDFATSRLGVLSTKTQKMIGSIIKKAYEKIQNN